MIKSGKNNDFRKVIGQFKSILFNMIVDNFIFTPINLFRKKGIKIKNIGVKRQALEFNFLRKMGQDCRSMSILGKCVAYFLVKVRVKKFVCLTIKSCI